MLWKLLAVFYSLLMIGSVVSAVRHLSELSLSDADLAFSLVAVIGLLGYAFRRALLPASFWRPFSWLYTCWQIYAIPATSYYTFLFGQAESDVRVRYLVFVAIFVSAIIESFVLLAVWRYAEMRTSGRHFGAASGRRSDQSFSKPAGSLPVRSAGAGLPRRSPPRH